MEQADHTVEIEPEHQTYDFDWFIRYYEAAGNISDEEMQILWAKILAGEIKQPGTYSLRSLDTLRNMSKQDAELFKQIHRCAIDIEGQFLLPNYKDYLDQRNITFDQILRLDEQGLLKESAFLTRQKTLSKGKNLVCYGDDVCLTADTEQENKVIVSIKEYLFTIVGNEIAKLMPHKNRKSDIIQLAKELKTDANGNVEIGVYNYKDEDETKIYVYGDNLLLNES